MTDREAVRRERQQRRWPVRVYPLGAEPADEPAATLTAEECIALVWTLSARAWELTGRPLPVYSRPEMPVAVIRRR